MPVDKAALLAGLTATGKRICRGCSQVVDDPDNFVAKLQKIDNPTYRPDLANVTEYIVEHITCPE